MEIKILKDRQSIKQVGFYLLGLIVIASIAYLPGIGQLGLYHDDWLPLAAKVSKTDISFVWSFDRPMMGVYLAKVYNNILGPSPLAWHLLAVLLRLGMAVVTFLLTASLWPKKLLTAFLVAVLALVYPGFSAQTLAVIHSPHMFAMLLAVTSILFSVWAYQARSPWLKGGLILLSVVLEGVYLAIMEYFVGLEAARLILIGYLYLRERNLSKKIRAILVVVFNVLCTAGFLYWRFFIFDSSKRPTTNSAVLFSQYQNSPLSMIAHVISATFTSFLNSSILGWFINLWRYGFETASFGTVVFFCVAAAAVGLAAWLLIRSSKMQEEIRVGAGHQGRDLVVLGALMLAVCLLPVTATHQLVQFVFYDDRYTLQLIPWIAMLVTGLILLLFNRRAVQIGLAGCLLVVSIWSQRLINLSFAEQWQFQQSLWQQVAWRVPDFQENTLLGVEAGVQFPEDFSIWAPVNYMYYGETSPIKVTSEVINADTLNKFTLMKTEYAERRGIAYTRDYTRLLLISLPDSDTCMHVIDARRLELSSREDAVVQLLSARSSEERIDSGSQKEVSLPGVVFKHVEGQGWCYYFQKASLERQRNDWGAIGSLLSDVKSQGLAPADVSEWMPFYLASVNLGWEDEAGEMAYSMKTDALFMDRFCTALGQSDTGSLVNVAIQGKVQAQLCAIP